MPTFAGVDHISLTVTDLEVSERFYSEVLDFIPVIKEAIRDMDLGYHLNFRDPDGIALEFYAPNELMAAALHELRTRDVSREEILAMARQPLQPEVNVAT